MITVLGATGGQGGAVAQALLASGQAIRAVVRNPAEPRARRLA
ncbi:NmrA family NAD(P)-binding protein, partial [Streptomyces sp. MCAF7]